MPKQFADRTSAGVLFNSNVAGLPRLSYKPHDHYLIGCLGVLDWAALHRQQVVVFVYLAPVTT